MRKFATWVVMVFLMMMMVTSTSCNQRFWFRKKVNMEKDTAAPVERDYKIVW